MKTNTTISEEEKDKKLQEVDNKTDEKSREKKVQKTPDSKEKKDKESKAKNKESKAKDKESKAKDKESKAKDKESKAEDKESSGKKKQKKQKKIDKIKNDVESKYKEDLSKRAHVTIIKSNKYIRNAMIVLIITTYLVLIDLTLKHFLFDSVKAQTVYDPGTYDWNIKVLAGRSLLHPSSTFLDFAGLTLPNWATLLIDFIIISLFAVIIIVSDSKAVVVGLAIALAGVMGNTMDNFYQGGVRDIFVTPWLDKGTFNLADMLIIIGVFDAAVSLIYSFFFGTHKAYVKKEIIQQENATS